MIFDGAKSFPHPVLRPGSSDYEKVEFQVTIEVDSIKGTTAVRTTAEFTLSDRDLLKLIDRGVARNLLVVKCPETNFRQIIATVDGRAERVFSDGEIAGNIEITPFCVATRSIAAFRATSWNVDYDGRSFDIPEGAVLAMDAPEKYWIDRADAHIGSIFEFKSDARIPRGQWFCELTDRRVALKMQPTDYRRFRSARDRVRSTPDGAYLMNGIYLPALLYLLDVVDTADPEELSSKRWYRSLEARLRECRCPPIGSESADRLRDAQTILENPFPRMPMFGEE